MRLSFPRTPLSHPSFITVYLRSISSRCLCSLLFIYSHWHPEDAFSPSVTLLLSCEAALFLFAILSASTIIVTPRAPYTVPESHNYELSLFHPTLFQSYPSPTTLIRLTHPSLSTDRQHSHGTEIATTIALTITTPTDHRPSVASNHKSNFSSQWVSVHGTARSCCHCPGSPYPHHFGLVR